MRHLIWLPLLFIFFIFPCELAFVSTHHLCPHDQMHALLEFKDMFTTDGYISSKCISSYPKTLSWNNKKDNNSNCCLWEGVKCNRETGNVIELDLSCSQLEGTISPNSSSGIFRLTHLRRLNLAKNDFIDSHISSAFGRFTHLTHLNLSWSYFSGSVPPAIYFLSKLVSLDIGYNHLLTLKANEFDLLSKKLTQLKELILTSVPISSSIPNSLMNLSSLEVLHLSGTGLHGYLPSQILMLPKLRELKLGYNDLACDFSEISAINTKSLEILELGWNALFEQRGLPDSIWNLTSLRVLDLSGMQFTGKLPDSIGSLKSLTFLGLRDCNFSGAIPKSLGNLTEIIELDLSDNQFHSQVPKLSNLKKLRFLNLRHNRLIGLMPTNSTNLEYMRLDNNMINGTLPPWLFTIPSLVILSMRFNQLTGPIHDFKYQSSLKRLDLSNNQLQGPIPDFNYESSLEKLDLSNNQLQGPIPDFNYESSLEKLDLSNNQLQGPIPNSMMNLVNLTDLNLSSNNLSGNVEPLLFSKLEYLQLLDLSRNFFEGSFPLLPMYIQAFFASHNKFSGNIPLSICNITTLVVLEFSNNDLDGAIPQCLLNNLRVLALQKNKLSGTIPPAAFGMMLETLNLNGNHLEGHVPESLANCEKLELLDLGRNRLNGSFPHWLESLPKLQVLILRSNKFQGPMGKSITKYPYPNLQIFDLSDNEFSGRLPVIYFQDFTAMKNSGETEKDPSYMKGGITSGGYYSIEITWKGKEVELEHILTTLATIDLSANRFEGEIPEVLRELISLRMLNLSHNNLTGPIPSSLGDLANLETLDLSSNILTGTIPMDLASIPSLSMFNVSNNHLVGSIPRGKQFNTFENNSYVGNSGLCGFPLSKCGEKKEPPPRPKVTKQREDDSIFSGGFTWKIVLFGYGCGVPFGLIIGFLMLFFGWPRWFLGIVETENRRKVKRPKGRAHTPRRNHK